MEEKLSLEGTQDQWVRGLSRVAHSQQMEQFLVLAKSIHGPCYLAHPGRPGEVVFKPFQITPSVLLPTKPSTENMADVWIGIMQRQRK